MCGQNNLEFLGFFLRLPKTASVTLAFDMVLFLPFFFQPLSLWLRIQATNHLLPELLEKQLQIGEE